MTDDRVKVGARTLSRRDLLRVAAFGGVAAFLAACGSQSPTPAPSASASAATALQTGSAPPSPSGSAPAPSSSPPRPSASAAGPTLQQQIAGLLIVGFRGVNLSAAPWISIALAHRGLGGVILFDRDQLTGKDRNVSSPGQVRQLVADLRTVAGRRKIIVSTDQEGGIVTRLGPAHGFPPVASQGDIGPKTASIVRTWAQGIASTLADSGLNLNFAPVVDLNVNPDSPAIGALHRSFSEDPETVAKDATIEVDAHRAVKVRTTLKHFPGIGSSTTNTDFGVADVTKTWTDLELEPYRTLIGSGHVDLIMAGHVVNGQIDAAHPASLSKPTVTGLLRGKLGWSGPIVTDDLQAAAITESFGADEAILLALEAGNDLLLFANQQVYDDHIVSHVVDVVSQAVSDGRLDPDAIAASSGRVRKLFAGALG
jgi:beta-N-acetylhexosaminidase